MKSKNPRTHSREWFERWFNKEDRSGFSTRRSESELRMTIMKAEAERDRSSAETVSYRKIALRLEKLRKLWYEASCRAGQAREELIILLRMQGRHDEADDLMPRERQGNDRTRAAAAKAQRPHDPSLEGGKSHE
jgi:hypothetical protein